MCVRDRGLLSSANVNDSGDVFKIKLKEQIISLFENNIAMLTLYTVSDICAFAQSQLEESDFQAILEILWKCVCFM